VNQVEFERHPLWSAVDDLRAKLIEADHVADPEQWHLLEQLRFDQLQYVVRGMRARRPPPEAAAAAAAILDRLHGLVESAAAELGAFLIDRRGLYLRNAAGLVDQALEMVGTPSRPPSTPRGEQRWPVAAGPVGVETVGHQTAGEVSGGSGTPAPPRARHAKRSRGSRLVLGIGALVVAVELGVVVALGAATGSDSSDPGAGCTGLRVVTTASYEPALDAVADDLASGDHCVRLDITVADGRSVEPVVDQEQAHVWITDDASWLERYEAEEAEEYGEGSEEADLSYQLLATSPVLFASSPAMAASIQRAGGGWTGLAALVDGDRPVSVVTRDPASTGDGLVALGGLGDAVWDSQGMDASALLLDEAYRGHRTESDLAASALAADEVALVPEHLLGGTDSEGPVITTPADRTVLMRYGWYVTEVDASDPAIRSARSQLLAALTEGPSADAALEAAHLRDVRGAPPATHAEDSWVGGQLPTANPVLDAHKVEHVFSTWYAADRKADLLVVVDVSGSMAVPAPGSGRPLIDLVRQNVKHLAAELPPDARLGVWGFGSQLDGARDYIVVDPFRPLTPDHRQRLARDMERLEAQDTGTGLYDTVYAAYRTALAEARPDVRFQVMVFTDGLNQDDALGISASGLHAALAEVADPEAPVGLTVVQAGALSSTRLEKALGPIDGEVVTIDSAHDVVASFIHLAAGGLHG